MHALKRMSQVFESSEELLFSDSSRIILMSDCHRGDGGLADDFSKNQNLYFTALNYYYNENYTYIEIGDGDELWENDKFSDIRYIHSDAFWILSRFYNEGRLYFIFGNHDMVKKDEEFVKNNLYRYFDCRQKKYIPLFENIKVREGLILRHKVTEDKIFLVHGHQVDYLNDRLWKLARFLVRFLWRPLESLGVNDPTSAAKNYERKLAVERKLSEWALRQKQMVISGHTHRPMFPEVGQPPYFNDGSSIHPRCITGIEIADGCITLVKWHVKTKEDSTLFIGREVISGPGTLREYFKALRHSQ